MQADELATGHFVQAKAQLVEGRLSDPAIWPSSYSLVLRTSRTSSESPFDVPRPALSSEAVSRGLKPEMSLWATKAATFTGSLADGKGGA